jgi:hypothetical protein
LTLFIARVRTWISRPRVRRTIDATAGVVLIRLRRPARAGADTVTTASGGRSSWAPPTLGPLGAARGCRNRRCVRSAARRGLRFCSSNASLAPTGFDPVFGRRPRYLAMTDAREHLLCQHL